MELDGKDLEIGTYDVSRGEFAIPDLRGIRILHKPTGIEVKCGSDKSIHKNKLTALKMISSTLSWLKKEEKSESLGQQSKPDHNSVDAKLLRRCLIEEVKSMKSAWEECTRAIEKFHASCERLTELEKNK